jgi:hypothetical protein
MSGAAKIVIRGALRVPWIPNVRPDQGGEIYKPLIGSRSVGPCTPTVVWLHEYGFVIITRAD